MSKTLHTILAFVFIINHYECTARTVSVTMKQDIPKSTVRFVDQEHVYQVSAFSEVSTTPLAIQFCEVILILI